jgi:hypothetical protein
MERISSKLIGLWLVGALALSLAFVGCGTLVKEKPSAATLLSKTVIRFPDPAAGMIIDMKNPPPGFLKPCTLPDGTPALMFDDLCSTTPPFGWTGATSRIIMLPPKVAPASFLMLPDNTPCKASQPQVLTA